MTAWSEGYVEANGIRVHYYRSGGSGASILLLHWIMDSGRCWPVVSEDLAQSYDVVTTDARGHGLTQGDLEGFSVPMLAEDAAGVIRSLGLERPFVYGHSMGAITAAALAAEHPGLVRGVVLEDPPFFEGSRPQSEREEQVQSRRDWLQELRSLPAEKRLAFGKAMNPKWPDEEIPGWVESKVQFNTAVLELAHAAFGGTPWREIVSRIECPVLLITGDPELGAIITPEVAREAARLLKQGELVRIRGAGHNIHRERYEETMRVVKRWLARIEVMERGNPRSRSYLSAD